MILSVYDWKAFLIVAFVLYCISSVTISIYLKYYRSQSHCGVTCNSFLHYVKLNCVAVMRYESRIHYFPCSREREIFDVDFSVVSYSCRVTKCEDSPPLLPLRFWHECEISFYSHFLRISLTRYLKRSQFVA